MRDDAQFLRHTSSCLFRDEATGRQTRVYLSVYQDGDHAWIVVIRGDGTINHADMPIEALRWWRAFLFPSEPPGIRTSPPTGTLQPVPDLSEGRRIVRQKIREYRGEPEAIAAD
jgi:hypothetical protein